MIFRIVILSLMCSCGTYGLTNEMQGVVEPMAKSSAQPSTLAEQIIDKLKIAPDYLKIDELPKADAEPTASTNYETMVLEPSEKVRDGFTHIVLVDPVTRYFWVIRTGGFAGVHEIRGPSFFTEDGQIEKVP